MDFGHKHASEGGTRHNPVRKRHHSPRRKDRPKPEGYESDKRVQPPCPRNPDTEGFKRSQKNFAHKRADASNEKKNEYHSPFQSDC